MTTSGRFTEAEEKILHAAMDNPLNGNITRICEIAGVDRGVYYEAIKKEPFRKAWDEIPKTMVRSYVPGALSALGLQAINGDVAAAKAILEMGGVYEQIMRMKEDYSELTDDELTRRKQRLLDRIGGGAATGGDSSRTGKTSQ